MDTLVTIAEEIGACDKCPLSKTRTCAVPGSGSGKSGIVFIGEGPGASEDKRGVPFIGAAGKFLDEMLADIGFSRADVFITNVVKCRPPNNRDPLSEEARICTEAYLWRQLNVLSPKVMVTLGRHAMYRFLPATEKISDMHGTPVHIKSPKSGSEFTILPLYHPAAALYNGGMRETLKEDFRKLPKILEQYH
ncbi:MAG: uracil-DNA glycosylase [Candidatus Yonathbacteria bacterium]|nr:uracil-DNA glycosylase [Candidatus Yonathbacteria bacterium]